MDSPEPGRVIFINGIPNAGKTTLAVALQRMLPDPYWHLSLDDFLAGFTLEHRRGPAPPPFIRVMHGYLASLRQMALAGNNVVAEAVITPHRLDEYLDLFGHLRVLLVGIHVSIEEAHRRERQRTDRLAPYEVTENDLAWVHDHGIYDLELDTSRLSSQEAAALILPLVDVPPSPTAFERMLARRNQQ